MWEQYLVGWVDTDDVACITKESITGTQGITLNPTDNPASGPEAVMIRINSEELIVIEYRAVGPYSTWKTGLTAYRVNVNGEQYRCDSCNQLESEALNWWGFIRQGGNEIITDVVHQGVRIRSLGGGRVQFMLGGKEIAWVRAIDAADPKLSFANGFSYLVRTVDLAPGKNRFEILVDGERVFRATYVPRG